VSFISCRKRASYFLGTQETGGAPECPLSKGRTRLPLEAIPPGNPARTVPAFTGDTAMTEFTPRCAQVLSLSFIFSLSASLTYDVSLSLDLLLTLTQLLSLTLSLSVSPSVSHAISYSTSLGLSLTHLCLFLTQLLFLSHAVNHCLRHVTHKLILYFSLSFIHLLSLAHSLK